MNTLSKTLLSTLALVALPLAASATCPSFEENGAPLSYTAETVWAPQSTQVIAGGDIDLSECQSVPGIGFVAQSPDFTIDYSDLDMDRGLELRVDGSCDTMLLVNTATGEWLFDDDSDGLDPALQIEGAISGQYDVWIGTLDEDLCEAELVVESF